MKLFFLFILTCITNFCFAQSDTTYFYLTKTSTPTVKDSAYNYVKMYQVNGVWHGKDYYTKTNILKSEGDYGDKSLKKPIGNFNNYTENGKLDFQASYKDGKPLEATYYYKDGTKKAYASFDDEMHAKKEKGWDESGKEIKNYIVYRNATFKNGPKDWQKFILENVKTEVSSDENFPTGQFIVEVEFTVNAEGSVSHVRAVSVPDSCKPCGKKAVQVIMRSPEWQPAIFQNEPVAAYFKQPVTFQISENDAHKKKH
jgi:hypothetical protein